MNRTRLYLDIDGVINALSTNFRVPPVTVAGYPIRMDVPLVRQFMLLFDEVVWATTWVLDPSSLDAMEKFMGIEERLNVIPVTRRQLDDGMSVRNSGKGPAVARHFDADPVGSGAALWIDDMLGPEDADLANSRFIRLHKPDPYRGAYPFIATAVDDGRTWRNQSKDYTRVIA